MTNDVQPEHKKIKTDRQNLRSAGISFALLVLSVVCFSLGLHSIGPDGNRAVVVWLVLFYVFMIGAGIMAFMTLVNCINSVKEKESNMSYAAMFISGLVLIAVIYEILQRIGIV